MRPGGTVPIWATAASYPAGAFPWSSTPTKVDPGSTLTVQGFAPNTRLPAQVMNWILNSLGVWVQYHDTLEVRTWSDPVIPQGASHDLANLLQDNCACYEADNHKLFIAGQDQTNTAQPRVLRSSNGETWTDDGAPMFSGSGQTYQIAYGPGNGLFAWISQGAGQVYSRRGLDGVWGTTFTLANSQKTYAVRWFIDRWVGAGEVSGPHVGVFTFKPTSTTGNAGTLATPALPGAGGVTLAGFIAPMIATDGRSVIAIAAPSPVGSDANVWYSADAVTWTYVVITGSGQPLAGLAWCDGDRLFYGVTQSGSTAKVYTSPTGAVWTLAATITTFAFSRSRAEHLIDTSRAVVPMVGLGGVVVASAQITTPDLGITGLLAIGRNKGQDWDVIQQNNTVPAEVGNSSSLSAIQAADNRIVTVRDDDVGGSHGTALAYSLRLL